MIDDWMISFMANDGQRAVPGVDYPISAGLVHSTWNEKAVCTFCRVAKSLFKLQSLTQSSASVYLNRELNSHSRTRTYHWCFDLSLSLSHTWTCTDTFLMQDLYPVAFQLTTNQVRFKFLALMTHSVPSCHIMWCSNPALTHTDTHTDTHTHCGFFPEVYKTALFDPWLYSNFFFKQNS